MQEECMTEDEVKRMLFIGPVSVNNVSCMVSGQCVPHSALMRHQRSMWNEFVAAHPGSFDGPLVRLKNALPTLDGIRLECERTSFSAYIATRDPAFDREFPGCKRADPIGLTVILMSADRRILVTQRSCTAEQNPGALYCVGGYAEPPEQDGPLDLVSEAARELREETGIATIDHTQAWLLGLAYDPVHCHPEAFMLIRVAETGDEILHSSATAVDVNETGQFTMVDAADILSDAEIPVSCTWSFQRGREFLRALKALTIGGEYATQ
jgi:8-oxo-dGTP pyrophosphatase MutT (NUDIX family)